MTIKEEFEKKFEKEFGDLSSDFTPEDWVSIWIMLYWAYSQGMMKATEIVNGKKLNGDYKDSPAAWLNCAYDNFEKEILSAMKEFEK